MLLFDFLQEKSRLLHSKILLLQVLRVWTFRAISNPSYQEQRMPTCRKRLRNVHMIPMMSPQSGPTVIGSLLMKMVKRKLLQRTLNATFRCAAHIDTLSETSREIWRSSLFTVVFSLLVFGRLVFWSVLGGGDKIPAPALNRLITWHSAVGAWLPCSSSIIRVWRS